MFFIVPLLTMLFIGIISIALILGLAVGIGWLLTLLLPFSLFEASLLALIASIVAGSFWLNTLNLPADLSLNRNDDEEAAYDGEYNYIAASRFYTSKAGKTWEAWLRFQLANSIYVGFQESPSQVAQTGEKQLQELSIRLADIAMPIIKAKTARSRKLSVSISAMKKQMAKIKQRPYDDKILQLAIMSINEELDYYYQDIMDVIRAKSWDAPCHLFEG